MLGVVAALEAWLLVRQNKGPQTNRLARHTAWFGCAVQERNLCGRARPICPYLHIDPAAKKAGERLKTLRRLGNARADWRCSEWHRVMDWYDARSGVAHGDPSSVEPSEAKSAEFWVIHYLMEPILEWLAAHETDPIGDLEHNLGQIGSPASWEAMLSALDSPNPPALPPFP